MNIKDLPEVKKLSDVLERLDKGEQNVRVQHNGLRTGSQSTFPTLGKTNGYSCTIRVAASPLDLDGCHIGEEMLQAALHIIANKRQQVLARLGELGVEFLASNQAKETYNPSDEEF